MHLISHPFELQKLICQKCIFIEQLVKLAELEENQFVKILWLDAPILFHRSACLIPNIVANQQGCFIVVRISACQALLVTAVRMSWNGPIGSSVGESGPIKKKGFLGVFLFLIILVNWFLLLLIYFFLLQFCDILVSCSVFILSSFIVLAFFLILIVILIKGIVLRALILLIFLFIRLRVDLIVLIIIILLFFWYFLIKWSFLTSDIVFICGFFGRTWCLIVRIIHCRMLL